MIWQWARKMTQWKDASLSMQQLLAVLWNICSTLVPGCEEAQEEHNPLLFIWAWLDMKSSGQIKHQLHKSTVPLITGTEHLPCSTYQYTTHTLVPQLPLTHQHKKGKNQVFVKNKLQRVFSKVFELFFADFPLEQTTVKWIMWLTGRRDRILQTSNISCPPFANLVLCR